ncbi:MAG: RNA polymerase sigma factor [Betaproteobacteria bacterium]|nr:RNA polymerase sigma factor [Betaproteobacteria bacterium]
MPRDASTSDEQLMSAYRDGDAGAFDELYRRHKGGVYRYMLRNCRDAALADELFQEVWMNLIRAREGYTVQAKFTTYIYTLAHNRLIDHYRQHGRAQFVSFERDEDDAPFFAEPLAAPRDEPERHLDVKQQAAQLLQLLGALPAPQREAFVMQYEAGMSVEEIADATGVTRETAKSRLRYALAKIRQGLASWP